MNWEDDVDFLVNKKSAPKQGRRAGNPQTPETTEQLIDNVLDSIEGAAPEAPIRVRKTGGWAEEGVKITKNKGSANLIEQERFQSSPIKKDPVDDIPEIPDLDDMPEELLNPQEMKTPQVLIDKSTYKELDSEFVSLGHAGPSSLTNVGDIDISIFTKYLYPEKDIQEPDTPWTEESLFNELIISSNNT